MPGAGSTPAGPQLFTIQKPTNSMTTPPVTQWAVDAIDDVKKYVPVPVEYRYFLARIIAAHAPQGNGDGARLDWLEKVCDMEAEHAPCIRIHSGHAVIWDQYDGLKNMGEGKGIRAAIDAARKKDL